MRYLWIFSCLLLLRGFQAYGQVMPAPPKTPPPGMFSEVRLEQKLGAQVPLDLAFTDEYGKKVTLGSYAGTKPIVLSLVYFRCPMLCTEVLNGMQRSFQRLPFTIGKEFEVVTVSIDPREGPGEALEKKTRYEKLYGKPGADVGWHFLTTADEASIKRLADTVGFYYMYDKNSDQYAHPAGIIVLTPQGKVARYLYGVDYQYQSLRLSLVEASNNRIGSPVDQVLLLCYAYDPLTGKYGIVVRNLLQIFAVIMIAGIGTFMFVMFRRDRKKAHADMLDAQKTAGDKGRHPLMHGS